MREHGKLLPFQPGNNAKKLVKLERHDLERALSIQALFATPEARHGVLSSLLGLYRFKDPIFNRITAALHASPATPIEEMAAVSGVSPVIFEELLDFDLHAPSLQDCAVELLNRAIVERLNRGLACDDVLEARQALQQPTQAPQSPFVNLADVDLSGNLAPAWLVRGYLEQDSLAVLFGPSGSGKSFMALALTWAVATGGDWNGQNTTKGVGVYLAGEGHRGILRRSKALSQHHNQPAPNTLIISKSALPFDGRALKTITTEAQAAADRAGVPVRLFVIDTLARHLVGDENSATDMGEFIRIADSLKVTFPGSSVLIVHHTGKADRDTGRGSSSLKGAADCEIRCMENLLTFTKTKDGPNPAPVMFKLVPVVIGITDEGEPVTSCVPEYGSQPARVAADTGVKLTRYEKQALNALTTVCAQENRSNHGKQYIATVDAWREEFYRLRRIEEPNETTRILRTQFRRAQGVEKDSGGLLAKQIVDIDENGAVLLRLAENESVKSAIYAQGAQGHNRGTNGAHVPVNRGTEEGHNTGVL